MLVRTALATLAIAALGVAPLASAQSASTGGSSDLSSSSLGSTGQGESAGWGVNLGTVSGDRSVGCDVEWVSEVINSRTVQDNDYFKDRDGNPVSGTASGGYVSEVGAGFGNPGSLQLQHWISGVNFNWRTPVATTVPINDAVLTFEFQSDTYTAAPTGQDVSEWFSTREEVFGLADYEWDVDLPAPKVTGSEDEGFTLTYNLGDLAADSALGVQLVGPTVDGTDVQRGTATLTGTYEEGSEECTSAQGSIGGSSFGSVSGSLVILDS